MILRATVARALCAIALAGTAIAGCSNSTSPGSFLSLAGSYALRAVNESPLPYPNGASIIVRGTLTIQSSANYTFTEVDSAAGGTTQLTSSGTWSMQNNAMSLRDTNGALYLAAVSGSTDTIRVQISTHVSMYVRQ